MKFVNTEFKKTLNSFNESTLLSKESFESFVQELSNLYFEDFQIARSVLKNNPVYVEKELNSKFSKESIHLFVRNKVLKALFGYEESPRGTLFLCPIISWVEEIWNNGITPPFVIVTDTIIHLDNTSISKKDAVKVFKEKFWLFGLVTEMFDKIEFPKVETEEFGNEHRGFYDKYIESRPSPIKSSMGSLYWLHLNGIKCRKEASFYTDTNIGKLEWVLIKPFYS